MRIINVGYFPPPYGGVSIHLQRLKLSMDALGRDNVLVDCSSKLKHTSGVIHLPTFLKQLVWLQKQPRSLVHFHNFLPLMKRYLFYLLVSVRHVTILSFHNERFLDQLRAAGRLHVWIMRFVLQRINRVIVDSEKCLELAGELVDVRKVEVIPEYISPPSVPDLDHTEILETRRNHRYLIASNAFQISFHNGQDLYGIDLLIDVVAQLHYDAGLDIALVFLLPRIQDELYFQAMKNKIAEKRLMGRFMFVTDPLDESVGLWKIADVVIRATVTDGNSLTVFEALSVGTPVIASDCVERPEGTILFKTGDARDLSRVISETLNNLKAVRSRIRGFQVPNYSEKFLDMYTRLEREDAE